MCDGRSARSLFTLDRDNIVKCADCDLVYAVSPLIPNNELYTGSYFNTEATQTGYQDYRAGWNSHYATFSRRLKEAEARLCQKGLLLDYGCAFGHLGKTATARGWTVIATDISFDAVKIAAEEHGLLAFVSDLSRPPLRPGLFDLVTLYDVIEHVRQPIPILQSLARLLKPQGRLHLTTPDVGSLSARALRTKWYHYKPREHLLYFDRRTLRSTLESCGFKTESIQSAPSLMATKDVLLRLRRYSRRLADFALRIASIFGLSERIIDIPIGEMEAWASPLTHHEARPIRPMICQPSSPTRMELLLQVIACPICEGDLREKLPVHSLECETCGANYEIRQGIPILLPPQEAEAKHTNSA